MVCSAFASVSESGVESAQRRTLRAVPIRLRCRKASEGSFGQYGRSSRTDRSGWESSLAPRVHASVGTAESSSVSGLSQRVQDAVEACLSFAGIGGAIGVRRVRGRSMMPSSGRGDSHHRRSAGTRREPAGTAEDPANSRGDGRPTSSRRNGWSIRPRDRTALTRLRATP